MPDSEINDSDTNDSETIHDCATTIHTCATVMKLISGVVSLGIILVLGAYTYTWSEMKGEQDEKRSWRTEHERILDKRFDELKKGQEKLTDQINKSSDDTKELLQKILDEQRRVSDTVRSSSKSR